MRCNQADAIGEIRITQATQAEFAGMLIGVGNIYEEELTDASGVTKSMLHASVFIEDLSTQKELDIRTRASEVIEFAGKRLLITEILGSKNNRGTISICRLNAP